MLSIALSIILGLSAAATNASPPHSSKLSPEVTPPKSKEFSLAMKVDHVYVPLFAVSNGTDDLVLRAGTFGQRSVPGTPGTLSCDA